MHMDVLLTSAIIIGFVIYGVELCAVLANTSLTKKPILNLLIGLLILASLFGLSYISGGINKGEESVYDIGAF